MAASYFLQIGVHTVTQSSPSPTISCVYNAPHIAEVSRITSADSVHGHSSSSSDGSTASRVLKDVHIVRKPGTLFFFHHIANLQWYLCLPLMVMHFSAFLKHISFLPDPLESSLFFS